MSPPSCLGTINYQARNLFYKSEFEDYVENAPFHPEQLSSLLGWGGHGALRVTLVRMTWMMTYAVDHDNFDGDCDRVSFDGVGHGDSSLKVGQK